MDGKSFTGITCWNESYKTDSLRRMVSSGRLRVVPSSPILVNLMKEVLSSSETSVLTRATRRNIPEEDILHSHRREDLKSDIALTDWTM
jgi:hypothetical protein